MTFARTALVIGNSDYAAAPLSNPVNDATDIANKLRELDFDVTIITNASRRQMRRGIRDYSEALRTNGGVGLFYYAGHGVQSRGENYLIPLKADLETEFDLRIEANRVQVTSDRFHHRRQFRNVREVGPRVQRDGCALPPVGGDDPP